jgi:cation transport ATPase
LSSYRAGTYEEITERGIDPGEWTETITRLRMEGKRVLVFTENETIIGVIAAMRPLIPGASDALKGLQEAGCEIWLLPDGSEDEAAVLNEKLQPEHMLVHPEKDERERLLAGLDEEDTITAYISMVPEETSQEDVDITVAIGTGAEPDKEKAGILLTRNRLSDFLYALNLSRQLNERIARKQMAILIYHAAAVLLFGFLLPAVADFPLAPALAVLCACLCLYAVINGKKEFR